MKRFLTLGLLAAAIAAGVLFARGDTPQAVQADTPIEAAAIIRAELEGGKNTAALALPRGTDEQRIFQTLEATWPYAFTLHITTRQSGAAEISVETAQQAHQEEAAVLAQGIARQQTQGLTDERDKLRALHDYLIKNCQYDTEAAADGSKVNGADAPFTAYGALVDGKAVCAGYARAFTLLCQGAGLDAIYVVDAGMNHGWNAVRLEGETYFIDCTFDDPVPDRGDEASDRYFLLTADELAETHTWDRAFYEQIMDQKWGAG